MKISRLATFLLPVAALAVIGCSRGRSIVGTWTLGSVAQKSTLIARPNGSFSIKGSDESYDGTWRVDGDTVIMFRDQRSGGGGATFGGSWDGSYRYKLNKAGDTMTSLARGPSIPAGTIVFHKAP